MESCGVASAGSLLALRHDGGPLISFDKLRMSGITTPLVVSLSNHTSGAKRQMVGEKGG